MTEVGAERQSAELRVDGAADRAGDLVTEKVRAIVTEQVRSIVEAAQTDATTIRREAEEDAERTRAAARDAAASVLSRIDGMDPPLNTLVDDLLSDFERLAPSADRDRA